MVQIRNRYPIDEPAWDEQVWLAQLGVGRPEEAQAKIKAALQFVQESLKGLDKSTYDPLAPDRDLMQGLQMAALLNDLHLDPISLISAILYPLYRDQMNLRGDIHHQFQEAVPLLRGLSELSTIQARHSGTADLNHLRFLLMAVVDDLRVILLKLAEHTVLMRLYARSEQEKPRRQMAQDTFTVYAPLANRLGIGQIKWELEDLALRALEPDVYKNIAFLLHEKRRNREDYINKAVAQIETVLNQEHISAKVSGRAKHIFGIWKKMRQKGLDYEEIHDIHAIRIIVEDIKACYAVLGLIHGLWPHIPKDFDDYIANPKENGYQSLHTGVIGPGGKTLEVQIRTTKMHEQAELGVAAHWVYKEGEHQHPMIINKLSALRQILHWQEEMSPDTEAAEAIRSELFEDRVYVFTPKGEVFRLPKGATPLDFAYHVHTEVGHRCRGAKVDGRMVPLTQILSNGEQIEILTSKTAAPSRDWLNPHLGYLKTAQARAKVQQWFKRQDRSKNLVEGRALLEKEMKRLAVHCSVEILAHHLNFSKAEDLYVALGAGDLRMALVLQAIQQVEPLKHKVEVGVKKVIPEKTMAGKSAVAVAGIGNLLCHTAKCCKPVPGDPIIGYIGVGRGVSIHRQDCANVLSSGERNQHRLVEVSWGVEKKPRYIVDILVDAYDRHGLVRDIGAVLAAHQVNILAMKSKTDSHTGEVHLKLSVTVANLSFLERVMTQIHHLPNVFDCHRAEG